MTLASTLWDDLVPFEMVTYAVGDGRIGVAVADNVTRQCFGAARDTFAESFVEALTTAARRRLAVYPRQTSAELDFDPLGESCASDTDWSVLGL